MITNLLGRKVKNQYSPECGVITMVYVDRGIAKAFVENPDNRLWEAELSNLQLEPLNEKEECP